ncbi:MAG: extracellular solute-binding protein [Candidatus Hadarchaeales archaeon]
MNGNCGKIPAAMVAVAVVAVVIIAAVALILPGTTQRDNTTSSGGIEIYHYWTSGVDRDAINALVRSFQDNYNINVSSSGFTGYQDKISLVIDTSPPDVAAHWFNKYYKDYASRGSLLDLTEFWENNCQTYPEKIKDLITVNGKIYGVPLDIHWEGGVVLYNLRVLSSKGINVPNTWDEFQDMLDELKSKGVERPIAMGFADAWPRDMVFTAILAATGGAEFYKDLAAGNARWTDSRVVEAFQIYQEWCQKGYFDQSAPGLDWQDALNTFISGDTAVYFMGDWACAALKKIGWQPNVDYYADFIPTKTGATPIAIPDLEGFVVPERSSKKSLALEFLKFISRAESQVTFASIKGSTAPHPNADINQYGDSIQVNMWNKAEGREWALPIMWYFSQNVRNEFGDGMYAIWDNPAGVDISEICASIDTATRS